MMMESIRNALSRQHPLTGPQHSALLQLAPSHSQPDSEAPVAEAAAVTPEQRSAVEALSAESGDSYVSCLRVWVRISDGRERRRVERARGLPLGCLDSDLPGAARALLALDHTETLDCLLEMFKTRNDVMAAEPARRHYVMTTTNKLLRDGLPGNCLREVGKHLTTLQTGTSHALRTGAFSRRAVAESSLLTLAEILFFVLYSTQITAEELTLLLQQIKALSSLLSDSPEGSQVSQWRASLSAALVTLQLAHLGALNQTSALYGRHVDAAPYLDRPDGEPGNALPQTSGGREGMDEAWPCGMARGFACLAYAVLRQPLVETGECPRADVLWFLRQAAALRGYSYVRLCVLPVLQTHFHRHPELLSFMSALLYELFENLTHMFSMPMYQLHSRGTSLTDTLPFFPLSQAQSYKDQTFALQARAHHLGAIETLSDVTLSDCLDDVMLLLGVLCSARPAFASLFWSGDAFHPFVGRAVELVACDPSLTASAARMLAGMALDPSLARGVSSSTSTTTTTSTSLSNAAAVYHFLRTHGDASTLAAPSSRGALNWSLVLGCVTHYAQQLSTPQAQRPAVLSPKDTDALLSFMDLIAAVCSDPAVASALVSQAAVTPVGPLLALLSCPVGPVLKGAILHALASLSVCSTAASDIWAGLEQYRLVPSKSLTGSEDTHRPTGLKLELEAVEARMGQYPVTDGLLSLLITLLETHPVPSSLGAGYRFPGILPYLDHVLSGVLLKASARLYLPEGGEGDSQRSRLQAKAVRVLVAVLRRYPINNLLTTPSNNTLSCETTPVVLSEAERVELELDFADLMQEFALEGLPTRTWPRPKSAGFVVMALLLDRSRSRLVDCLLSVLKDLETVPLEEARVQEAQAVGATSVELLALLARSDRQTDLTAMGQERCECDGAHWREVLVTQVLTLLHECAVREETFLNRLSGLQQLTLFQPEAARLECTPLLLLPLSRVLGWTPRLSPIALLANTMSVQVCSTRSSPSLQLMAVHTLEHLSRYHPVDDNSLTAVDSLLSFQTSCVAAISAARAPLDNFELTPRGYDPLTSVARLTATVCVETREPPYTETLALRGAVLSFLLTTLSPTRLSIAHYLLGLDEVVLASYTDPTQLYSVDALAAGKVLRSPVPGAPLTCLEAVLDLLLGLTEGGSAVAVSVDLCDASKALELLYRLCADTRTSLAVLGLLRKRSVNLLCRLVAYFSSSSSSSSPPTASHLHACAWLLRLCALELHVTRPALRFSRSQGLAEQLFLGGDSDSSSSGSAALFVLLSALPTASLRLDALIDTQGAVELIKRSQFTYSPSVSVVKGVAGPFGVNPANEPPLACTHISLPRLQQLLISLEAPIVSTELLLAQAAQVNAFSAVVAAGAHLAMSGRQVMETYASTVSSDAYHYTLATLLIPAAQTLDSCLQLEMPVLEQLARGLLRAVELVRELLASDEDLCVSGADLETLLGGAVRALLRRGHEAASPSTPQYRACVLAALTHMLRMTDVRLEPHCTVLRLCVEPRVGELVEIMCRQAGTGSTHRAGALATLGGLVQSLREEAALSAGFDGLSLSPALVQLLGVLQARCHVSRLISDALATPQAYAVTSPGEVAARLACQEATLSLLVQLTQVDGGTGLIVDSRLFEPLAGLRGTFEGLFLVRPISNSGLDGGYLQRLFLHVLTLLRCMLVTSTSATVTRGVATFISHNKNAFAAALRLKDLTAQGLELCEAATGVLAVLATDRSFETLLEGASDALLLDTAALLTQLGLQPAPRGFPRSTDGWWSLISPVTSQEILDAEPTSDGKASVFTRRVLALGRRVLLNVATTLRLCSAREGLSLAVELESVGEVFIACSQHLAQSTSTTVSPRDDWLESSQALTTASELVNDSEADSSDLVLVAESLLCAVLELLSSAAGRASESTAMVRVASRVAAECAQEHHLPHSFMRFTGGRITQLLTSWQQRGGTTSTW